MESKTQGGKRIGAGRKPIGLKKKSVFLYIELNDILKFGSEEKMKVHLYDTVKKYGQQSKDAIQFTKPQKENFDSDIINSLKSDEVGQWQEPKKVLVRSFQQYNQLKLDCENQEDWSSLSEEIRNSSLSTKQKQILLN